MKVLVLYTLPPPTLANDRAACEFDLNDAATAITAVLPDAKALGVVGVAQEILAALADHQPDVVFNLCEAPLGRPDLEAQVAAIFELHGVPFTGSGSETLALCRRKDRTKAVLAAAGVPVPRPDRFPCVVKPADEDGSAGVHDNSLCDDAAAVKLARSRIAGPAIVEEFLPGREFAISLWGRTEPDHVSIGETIFEKGLKLLTYTAKWDVKSPEYLHSQLQYDSLPASDLRETLLATARNAWRAVSARGYLRMDVRLDRDGVPRVMDVNPNPEVSPEVGMHRAVIEAGWTWERFVNCQVNWASGKE